VGKGRARGNGGVGGKQVKMAIMLIAILCTINQLSCIYVNVLLPAKQFSSLASWLAVLRLSEYVETFQLHGFTTLDKLHNLWDVELTSVSVCYYLNYTLIAYSF